MGENLPSSRLWKLLEELDWPLIKPNEDETKREKKLGWEVADVASASAAGEEEVAECGNKLVDGVEAAAELDVDTNCVGLGDVKL